MSGTYPEVAAIALACQHPLNPDYPSRVPDEAGRYHDVCLDCGNAARLAYRYARKAELAARPKDCHRCGARPHTFILAGFQLCGRCKTATRREHHRAQAAAGPLGLFATGLLVNTSSWAIRRSQSG